MIAEVQKGIDAANENLARVEQIKSFTIVRGDWLPGGDELTPTMKLKRKPIGEQVRERHRRALRLARAADLSRRACGATTASVSRRLGDVRARHVRR